MYNLQSVCLNKSQRGRTPRTQYGIQPGVRPLTPNGMGSTLYETNGTASPDSQAGLPFPDELTRVDYCGNMLLM